MSSLLAALLLDDVEKDWDEGAHPRDEGGRFAGAGFTQAGGDPKALARAAGQAARMGMGGSKTLAREAKGRARAAGAPKGESVKAGAGARAAVRRELGQKYVNRPEGFKPVEPKPKPPVDLKPPVARVHGDEERHLTTSNVSTEVLKKGSNINETRFVTFQDGSKGVFKPDGTPSPHGRGEDMRVLRDDIKPGKSLNREVATYDVAKIVGMHDMVPATVQRTFESGPPAIAGRTGSLMKFVDNAQPAAEQERHGGIKVAPNAYDGSEDFARAAMFDYVTGNTDRHPGNWMVSQPGPGELESKLHLIDHGLTFPESKSIEPIRGFMEKAGKDGPSRWGHVPMMTKAPTHYAQVYRDNKDQILSALRSRGIPEKAIAGVSSRIDHTSNWGSRSDWKHMNPSGGGWGW
jgi:hypothetical protein